MKHATRPTAALFTALALGATASAPAAAAQPVEAVEAAEANPAIEHWHLQAAPPPPEVTIRPSRNLKDPGLATALTVATPLAIGLAGFAWQQAQPTWLIDNRWNGLDAGLVVSPLGLSAGYFYTGEPADGMLIGLFGSAAMATGLYFSRGGTLSGTFDPQAATIWPLLVSAGVVLFAGAFAASDVQDLAKTKNKDSKDSKDSKETPDR